MRIMLILIISSRNYKRKKKYYINQTPIAFQQTVMKNRFDNENSPNTRNLGTVVELSTMEKPIWD